jgi:hypothetical protein
MWRDSQWPGVYHIIYSTDSEFQLAKPLAEHISELQANGMTLHGGYDVQDDPDPLAKSIITNGSYVTVSSGVPTKVAKPETPEELASRLQEEERQVARDAIKAGSRDMEVLLIALGLNV